MAKTDKNFRLSKESKRIIALLKTGPESVTTWKKAFIEAQVSFEKSKTRKVEIPQGDE